MHGQWLVRRKRVIRPARQDKVGDRTSVLDGVDGMGVLRVGDVRGEAHHEFVTLAWPGAVWSVLLHYLLHCTDTILAVKY
jgi:hypothetical protein